MWQLTGERRSPLAMNPSEFIAYCHLFTFFVCFLDNKLLTLTTRKFVRFAHTGQVEGGDAREAGAAGGGHGKDGGKAQDALHHPAG